MTWLLVAAALIAAGAQAVPPSSAEIFPGDGAHASAGAENVHDPTIVWIGDRYFCFSTSGNGFAVVRSSKDMRSWTVHGPLFTEFPAWLKARYRHQSIWAPDVVVQGNRVRVYYCMSNWGSNQSVIGLAECERFDPNHPLVGWRDLGLVMESRPNLEPYNCIDPEVEMGDSGRPFLFFGSYFGGIYAAELDPGTGKLRDAKAEPVLVARNTDERGNPLEGAAVCRRGDYYYLFVSYGLAAQGVRSTYRVMVGRSKSITGPFLDADGRAMTEGGHVNVLKTSPPMFSPGHSDVLQDPSGRWLMPYHFYDGRRIWHGDQWGLPTLQVRELLWSADGWPLPGLPVEFNRPKPSRSLAGVWTVQTDFGEPLEMAIRADGTYSKAATSGRWQLEKDELRMDTAGDKQTYTVSPDRNYFVGRARDGKVMRAVRTAGRGK